MHTHLQGKKHRKQRAAMMTPLVIAPSMKSLVIATSVPDLLRTICRLTIATKSMAQQVMPAHHLFLLGGWMVQLATAYVPVARLQQRLRGCCAEYFDRVLPRELPA
jgi:hypothetical protein